MRTKNENKSPVLFDHSDNVFIYKGKKFRPAVFRVHGDFFSIMRNCGNILLERKRDGYSWKGFYKASGCDYDLFEFLDNGFLYIPCENYLFHYFGKEARDYNG
jgi:hypothetical protein